jgi:hypothetical protein
MGRSGYTRQIRIAAIDRALRVFSCGNISLGFQQRVSGWMSSASRVVVCLLFLAAVCGAVLPLPGWRMEQAQEDRLTHLQSQFEHENDPVRKAKALSKLQSAQFDRARKIAGEGQAEEALRVLEQYRDEVRTVSAALDASGIDAEKRPDGFKQLQISLRQSIRQLKDLSLSLPSEQRNPFEAILQELESINKRLLHRLFPRQPGHKKSSD